MVWFFNEIAFLLCMYLQIPLRREIEFTTLNLLKIHLLNKSICKPPDTLVVGMGANLHLSTYKKSEKCKDYTNTSLNLYFHKGVISLMSNITTHMIENAH